MPEVTIRHADPVRDGAACAAIYAPYVEESSISFESEAPTPEEMAARIERYSSTHQWLVAERDGQVVGFTYASPHRDRAAYRWATDVGIYLHPRAHRQGVGRMLYHALFALLADQGYHVACAGIGLPNDASVGLHEAMGFRRVGVYRRIGFKEGEWRDVGWWQRELLPPHARPTEPRAPERSRLE
jgi:phosphinothricin acetyltransferase